MIEAEQLEREYTLILLCEMLRIRCFEESALKATAPAGFVAFFTCTSVKKR